MSCNLNDIKAYHVWRIFTTLFGETSRSVVILIVCTSATFMARFEKSNASVVLFYEIFAIGLAIQFFLIGAELAIYVYLTYIVGSGFSRFEWAGQFL